MIRTAIMVDGGFYQKRARTLFGEKTGQERANELYDYCLRHLRQRGGEKAKYLYRIFVYDCPPAEKTIMHPLTQRSVNLKKTDLYTWSNSFHEALITKRKVALRMGELLESTAGYALKPEVVKRLCRGETQVADLKEQDFRLDIQQKGVDMRIGLDIASLAYKRLVDQIVLIAGDSDFVPAAKHARREGIDFVLDPMWHTIKPSLNEHIDGLHSCVEKPPANHHDSLCVLPPETTEEPQMPSESTEAAESESSKE